MQLTFPVRHVAAALRRNDVFAVGAFDKHVQLVRRDPTRSISTFDTVLSGGGARLALCATPERIVVAAGAWERYGVVAYDGETGVPLWRRPDLKQVQVLSPVGDGSLLAVGMERRSIHVLDVSNGETAAKVRAIRELWQAPDAEFAVGDSYQRAVLVETGAWSRQWSAPIAGFAILDAAFAPHAVAVADTGDRGYVYSFDLDGVELWRYELPRETLCWSLAWDEDEAEWVGLSHNVARAAPDTILRWSPNGRLTRSVPQARQSVAADFLPGGAWLVTDRDIVDTRTGAYELYSKT